MATESNFDIKCSEFIYSELCENAPQISQCRLVRSEYEKSPTLRRHCFYIAVHYTAPCPKLWNFQYCSMTFAITSVCIWDDRISIFNLNVKHWSLTAKPQGQKSGIFWLIQDGEEVFFKIKNTTQLKKLMDAYCKKQIGM